jgi:uncharacterized iron-regulated membrane protein
MKLRKSLFWIHLAAGCVAGIAILIMSVTGVLLAYERQLTNWANSAYKSLPQTAGQARLSMDELLTKVRADQGSAPSAITVKPDAAAPVQFGFGRDRTIFVNAYSGAVEGEGSPGLHAFFAQVESVHRYLGASEASRTSARALTGACNLAFLVLLSTGPFLWWPKDWTWKNLRKIVTFRGGLAGRARDWNWHNVLGVWCFAPLLLVVLTGVVMSYPWANSLLYRMTGNLPPPAPQRPNSEETKRPRRQERIVASEGPQFPSPALATLFARAEQQVSGWQSVTLRLPGSSEPSLVFSIDQGNGGRPDKRAQLTLDSRTGALVRWEPFSSYNLGRRLRTWARFTHTGEVGGLLGQTIAATASAGAAVLVWTGLALALRRCNGWRKRFSQRALAQS